MVGWDAFVHRQITDAHIDAELRRHRRCHWCPDSLCPGVSEFHRRVFGCLQHVTLDLAGPTW